VKPQRLSAALAAASLVFVSGCATISDAIDAVNPFSSSGPKMAELTPFTPTVDLKTAWTASMGKAAHYALVPAVVGNAVFVAGGDGGIAKFEEGVQVWRVNAGQSLSGGVGSDGKLVVVGTAKGDVLAFAAADGKPLWQTRVSSEVLAPPAVGEPGVAVRSGDNRVFLLDGADGKRKWVYQRPTPSLSLRSIAAPVFADRFIFVGFPGGKLVALDADAMACENLQRLFWERCSLSHMTVSAFQLADGSLIGAPYRGWEPKSGMPPLGKRSGR
jgi:outer membrane protein assembly factor BamB